MTGLIMPAVWLLRHAQASFATEDYDRLSELGRAQAGLVGQRLSSSVRIGRVVSGDLRRQVDTAEAIPRPDSAADRVTDRRWNEFDQDLLLGALLSATERLRPADRRDPERLREAIDNVSQRWAQGQQPVPGPTFADFTADAIAALDNCWSAAPSHGDTVVVTSAGVIAAVCVDLLGLSPTVWPRLNRVMVNTGITKVIHGRRGTHLVTMNDHAHLEASRSLVTYS